MLSFRGPCGKLGRREFLRIGSLALGGVSLPHLHPSSLAASDAGVLRGKSVVLLFLHGGPSQTETFDPNMDAPAGIRSATGEVRTTLPGVTFGGTFPKLAAMADRLAVVRSFVTGDGNHDIKPVVARDTRQANLGSIYARVAGANHPVTGVPRNAALFPRAVDAEAQARNMAFGRFDATGALGSAYAPFIPGAGGNMQDDLRLHISRTRLDDRRELLRQLDRLKRTRDAAANMRQVDDLRDQAFGAILGGVADAFDLKQEDPKVLARYDTVPLVRPENISRKWNNYNNYVDNARSLGKLLLLARRLCEAGCGFVTVTTNFVWDMHADVNNATMTEGMHYMGLPLDHAVSAFLEDVAARGLSDDILLIACGEMGRTPKMNDRGGRDHWGALAPLVLAGGGLPMGQVIGQSNRDNSGPATSAVTIENLVATTMHTLFDIGKLRTIPNLPRDVVQVATGGQPIPELV